MRNIARFFLILSSAVVLGILALIFIPVYLGVSFIFGIISGIGVFIFSFISIFAFFWFLAREEPELKDSKSYSIKQGKEVKK